jgi:hypothetical protein
MLTFCVVPQTFAVSHVIFMHEFGKMHIFSPIHKTALFVSIIVINKMLFPFDDFPVFAHIHEQRTGAYQTFKSSSRRIVCHPFFCITFSLHL